MKDSEQSYLNGAYYGPSVPPPAKAYRRPGRGGACCCGGGACCGCCFLSLFLKLIIAIVVILGLAILIFWLIVRPRAVKFHVTDAALTQFNHTENDSTLRYRLALTVSVRNPNKRIGVYYDRIESRAYYEDKRFSTRFMTPFYQGHKNTTVLTPVFQGQDLVLFDAKELRDFNAEKISGVYSIDVELRLRVRFKLGKVKTRRYRPKVVCELKLPLNASNGTRVSGAGAFQFQTTKCDFDF